MTLRTLEAALIAAGIPPEDAAFEARLLCSHFTGISPARLLTVRDEELSCPALAEAAERRMHREPLQYILGEWEFMGLSFAVSPACLIPRPDTETLVEAALPLLPKGARCADLCTGSGCIGCALAHSLPGAQVAMLDNSSAALELAKQNIRQCSLGTRAVCL